MKILLGADPEFFLMDKDKNPISAHDQVPGTKANPHPLKCGGMVQADGTAVEFNIAPADNAVDFKRNMSETIDEIRSMVDPKLKFNFSPAVFYPEDYFDKYIPDTAKELGCTPDYNADTGHPNEPPVPEGKYRTMRSAAGHIHFGWGKDMDISDESHLLDCKNVIKYIDPMFQGMSRQWDKDKNRQQLYGKTPCYRPKPYGVEYRRMSVAWVNYPNLYSWIFDSSHTIFDQFVTGAKPFESWWCLNDTNIPIQFLNELMSMAGIPNLPKNAFEATLTGL